MRFLKEKKPIPKENPPKNLKTPTLSKERLELLPQKKQKTDTINKAKNEHFFENPKFLESIDKALEKSQIIIENDAKSEKKNEIKIKKPAANPKIVEVIVDNDDHPSGNKNNNEIIQQNGDLQVIENNFSNMANKTKKKVLIPTPLEKISEKKEIFIVSRNSEVKKIIIPPQQDLIIPPLQDSEKKIEGNEFLESSLTKENPENNKKSEDLKHVENSKKKTELINPKNFQKKNSDSHISKENPDFTPNKLLERLKAGNNYKNELIVEENSKKQEESSQKIKKVDKTPKKPQIQDKNKEEPAKNADITIQELNIPGAFQEITAKKEKNPAKKTPKIPTETIPVDSVNNLDIKEAKQQRKIQRMMQKVERHLAGQLSDISPEKTSEDENEEKKLAEISFGTKKKKK